MEEPNNSKMDLNKKGVKVITSQFIDLGLPEDRKPMSISNYKNGQRWGWVKAQKLFDVDYDKDIKNEYNVAESPKGFPRNCLLYTSPSPRDRG